mgnify:CR=1 FL=1
MLLWRLHFTTIITPTRHATLQQTLHDAHAALAQVAQQRHATVHQQRLLLDGLRVKLLGYPHRVDEEGVDVAVDGVVLLLLLLLAQHLVFLRVMPFQKSARLW